MTFWQSEIGEISGQAADAFAKSFKTIPDGTKALARIESFVNAEFNGNKYLTIEWVLTDGDFRGAKVNQKLKVFGDSRDKDPAYTRYRALNMLKLLFQLFSIKPAHGNPPTDEDLFVFKGKTAGIIVRETEPNDNGKQYNWVSEVHCSKGFKCETGITVLVTHVNPAPQKTDSLTYWGKMAPHSVHSNTVDAANGLSRAAIDAVKIDDEEDIPF